MRRRSHAFPRKKADDLLIFFLVLFLYVSLPLFLFRYRSLCHLRFYPSIKVMWLGSMWYNCLCGHVKEKDGSPAQLDSWLINRYAFQGDRDREMGDGEERGGRVRARNKYRKLLVCWYYAISSQFCWILTVLHGLWYMYRIVILYVWRMIHCAIWWNSAREVWKSA